MVSSVPSAAVVSAAGIPIRVATCPHKMLPSASPPMNTTTNAASRRARTHADSVIRAETCNTERIEIRQQTAALRAGKWQIGVDPEVLKPTVDP